MAGIRRTAPRATGVNLWWAGVFLVLCIPATAALVGQNSDLAYDKEPINYSTSAPHDAVTELQAKLDRGEVHLKYEGSHGYLLSVLQNLHVPVTSQMLVFSKTSFQHNLISPRTPRALYFNDSTYVGWVQGGDFVEVSAVDPQLGAVFYLLPQRETAAPQFARRTTECLECHDFGTSGGEPGYTMRSVYTDGGGMPIFSAGTYVTSDQSPMSERWGGWYVTGTHGTAKHMGNLSAMSETDPQNTDWSKGANVVDLRRFLDTSPYLTRYSDIVALLVAEHQTQVQDRIIHANYETRRALHGEAAVNKELGRAPEYRSDGFSHRIASVCEPLVKAMLFVGAPNLTAQITGTSGYAERFESYGPFDHRRRSLREFDLKRRLFRYPCSYLIYSAQFDGLPAIAKNYVYLRLEDILNGKDRTPEFSALSDADRQAILEILLDTKPDFAEWESRRRLRI